MSVGADGKMRLRKELRVEAWSGHEWWSRLLSGMTSEWVQEPGKRGMQRFSSKGFCFCRVLLEREGKK